MQPQRGSIAPSWGQEDCDELYCDELYWPLPPSVSCFRSSAI